MSDDSVWIRYLVDDVAGAVGFYTRHLASRSASTPRPQWRRCDEATCGCSSPGRRAPPRRELPDGRRPEPGGWNRLHFIVDDIEAEVERLRAEGVGFRSDVIKGPGGRQSCSTTLPGTRSSSSSRPTESLVELGEEARQSGRTSRGRVLRRRLLELGHGVTYHVGDGDAAPASARSAWNGDPQGRAGARDSRAVPACPTGS